MDLAGATGGEIPGRRLSRSENPVKKRDGADLGYPKEFVVIEIRTTAGGCGVQRPDRLAARVRDGEVVVGGIDGEGAAGGARWRWHKGHDGAGGGIDGVDVVVCGIGDMQDAIGAEGYVVSRGGGPSRTCQAAARKEVYQLLSVVDQ